MTKFLHLQLFCGAGLVLVGVLLLGVRLWTLLQYNFQDATVQRIEEYGGKCRLRIGKYLPCERYRAEVTFLPEDGTARVVATIEAGDKSQHLTVNSIVKIMYLKGRTEEAVLASIRHGWIVPLSVLILGVLTILTDSLRRDTLVHGKP